MSNTSVGLARYLESSPIPSQSTLSPARGISLVRITPT